MKKYKLIKEYPGSPELGFIVFDRINGMYHNIETGNMYGSQHIENQSEFWEEVVKKDYEILKSCPIEGTIISVKRLSDGEVFTLGDKIKVYQHGSTKTIDSIDLYGNTSSMKEGIWLRYSTGSCHMTHIIKQKPQIYLTLNGKDIFEGDTVWYVNKENFYHDYIKAYPEVKFNSEIRAYFLTQEEAKDYIERNYPRLSIEDCFKILQKWHLYGLGFKESIEKYVTKNNK